MKKCFYPLLCSVLLNITSLSAIAQTDSNPEQGYTRFDDYTVYYSVFNSTAVQADIAKLHQLTRAENQVLVNVALVANDSTKGGQAAEIDGSVSNLMQQRRELDFKTIAEGNVTYYLAPLRITDEEVLHFTIDVKADDKVRPYTVKFSKKLYVDR